MRSNRKKEPSSKVAWHASALYWFAVWLSAKTTLVSVTVPLSALKMTGP